MLKCGERLRLFSLHYAANTDIWRAWEYAAYQRFTLPEPVLDAGCGDGRFFRLVWPAVQDVIGVDMDSGVANWARQTGIYRAVHTTRANQLPFPPETFASAFANRSPEHMDENLTKLLRESETDRAARLAIIQQFRQTSGLTDA
jgi:SAM-dependent methyltransferase